MELSRLCVARNKLATRSVKQCGLRFGWVRNDCVKLQNKRTPRGVLYQEIHPGLPQKRPVVRHRAFLCPESYSRYWGFAGQTTNLLQNRFLPGAIYMWR